MTRYAQIIGGLVSNVVESSAPLGGDWVQCPDQVGPGWRFNGQAWHLPGSLIEVPESVEMWQARLALLEAGHLAAVEALIEAMPSPQKEAAKIEWEFKTRVRRNSPLVAYMAANIPLTSAAVDQLFIEAATK